MKNKYSLLILVAVAVKLCNGTPSGYSSSFSKSSSSASAFSEASSYSFNGNLKPHELAALQESLKNGAVASANAGAIAGVGPGSGSHAGAGAVASAHAAAGAQAGAGAGAGAQAGAGAITGAGATAGGNGEYVGGANGGSGAISSGTSGSSGCSGGSACGAGSDSNAIGESSVPVDTGAYKHIGSDKYTTGYSSGSKIDSGIGGQYNQGTHYTGIGKAVAEALVKKGVIVAGIARRVDRLNDLSKKLNSEKGRLVPYQCDLAKQEQILSTFKKITSDLGPIYILANCAGLLHGGFIIDGDIEKWKYVLDVNILALSICSREAIASMKAHKIKGHIININSLLGHFLMDIPGLSIYPATKHAVTALTETLRLEFNRENLPIKIASISPGFVKTEFVGVAWGEESEKLSNTKPGLLSEDIADAALYILSTPDHVNVTELTLIVQGEYA